MELLDAINASIRHWERMRSLVEDNSDLVTDDYDGDAVQYLECECNERVTSEHCALCMYCYDRGHVDCSKCPLARYMSRTCSDDGSVWRRAYDAPTPRLFVRAASDLLRILGELYDEELGYDGRDY